MISFKDFQTEKRYNDLQREAFITKILAELTVDLEVCKLMYEFNEKEALKPIEEWKIYLEKIKKEIDRLYERTSNR